MQNEVRAPRAGRVIEVAVAPGQAVATGAPLLRLEWRPALGDALGQGYNR